MIEMLIGAAGWILAALLVGLWLGERGRRIDAQRREAKLPVVKPERAKVIPPADAAPDVQARELAEARQRYIDEAVAEGYSAKDAAADFDRMMASVSIDRGVEV